MNSNLAWLVIFLNLAAIAAGLTYVAVKPAEVRAVMAVLAEEGERQQTRQTSQATTQRPPRQTAQATTPATPVDAPPPRVVDAPPPRTTTAGTEEDALRATTDAVYLGPSTTPIRGEQPQPFLYPFRPVRRTFPDDGTVEVEFLVGNFSGRIWNPAEIVLKAPGFPQSQVFRVDNWRMDEIASLKYRFPRAELDRRMELLRVVEVRGTQRQSARGEQVAMDRETMMQNFGQQVGADQGLMRLITGALGSQMPGTNGSAAAPPRPGVPQSDKLEVFLPGSPVVLSAEDVDFELTTDSRREIAEKWTVVLGAARTIVQRADEVAILVGNDGYEAAMGGDGKEAVMAIMDAKATYDKTGLDLALAVGRSNDPALKQLQTSLDSMSREILNVMNALQDQLQTLDRTFTLGVSGP